VSAPTADAIFEFLSGVAPRPGTAADRVRKAVLNPDADPEAAAALVRFRAAHKDLLQAPRVQTAVREFRQRLSLGLAESELPLAEPIPDPPRTGWRDLFDRLVAHCRGEFTGAKSSTPVGSAESLVSTILSSYISGAEAGRYGDLHDPKQIWPVLLEIAARKMKRKLTPETVADPRFADALGSTLEFSFREVARGDRERVILAHTLFGRNPAQIETLTHDFPDDVANVVRALHADLHLHLTNAA
jgi:hypothetical protein